VRIHKNKTINKIRKFILANQTGVITGPNSFSIDLIGRMYNVSITCPNGATCMWYLDNYVINSTSSTSVILIFKPENVGNRTLSYAKIISNNPLILASLLLSILPSTIQGKVFLRLFTYMRSFSIDFKSKL
jgi:hypothetical protein